MALNINGTTGISGVDGSVSAPAVTGTDSNTGITFPSANTIKLSTGGVERMSITNSGVVGTGLGKILQVVHIDKSDYFSTTSTSHTDITGLTASITPTSASNYILVEFKLVCSGGDNLYATLRLQRQIAGGSYGNPSVITSGSNGSDAGHSGADTEVSYGQYKTYNRVCRIKDQPNTTLQVNYKIQVRSQSAGFVLNRTGHSNAGNTSTSQAEGTSSITLMEVAA